MAAQAIVHPLAMEGTAYVTFEFLSPRPAEQAHFPARFLTKDYATPNGMQVTYEMCKKYQVIRDVPAGGVPLTMSVMIVKN
jgi:hypothetical protein